MTKIGSYGSQTSQRVIKIGNPSYRFFSKNNLYAYILKKHYRLHMYVQKITSKLYTLKTLCTLKVVLGEHESC